jgi:hypothetical protein
MTLKNPFYYGLMDFNGELHEGIHDPPSVNAAANRRRKPARFALHESGQDGQAEMLRAEAESAEAGRSVSACWSWPTC